MITFQDDLEKRLSNPEFAKAWADSEADYQVARAILDEREALGMTQKELAKAAGMRQEAISRLETGATDPRLSTLERVAQGFGKRLVISFRGEEDALAEA